MSGTPDSRPSHAAVVGTTAWGCTLAVVLARNGVRVTLLARTGEEAARLQSERLSPRVPGVALPDPITVTWNTGELASAEFVCFAVPAQTLGDNARSLEPHLPVDAPLLSAAKGLELSTARRMSEVLADAAPGHPLAALSGPNLSREVAAGLPGTTVIAANRPEVAERLRAAFHSSRFRVYTSDDLAGVEFGGALKNVVAVAAGMVDAFKYGDNAKAAIITRGLAEITRLGVAAGANPLTFQGLAGVGDLMASAYSPLARNRRVGEWLGGGMPVAEALAKLGEIAEGVATTPAALGLAERFGVEMPIASALHSIIEGEIAPLEAVEALLGRDPTSELASAAQHRSAGGR